MLAIAVPLLLLAALAPQAQALTGYRELGAIATGPGTAPGEVTIPYGLAVAPSGRVFVVSQEMADGSRILVFDPDGDSTNYVTEFSLQPGQVAHQIALDESTGALYLASINGEIRKFVSDGSPVPVYTVDPAFESPTWGSEPDQLGGLIALEFDEDRNELVVLDRPLGTNSAEMKRFTPMGDYVPGSASGNLGSPFGRVAQGTDIEILADGNLLIAASNQEEVLLPARVFRFAPDGEYLSALELPGDGFAPTYVTEDRNNDQIVVGSRSPESGRVFRFDVYEGDARRFTFRTPKGIPSEVNGVAAGGPAPGRLYFSHIDGPGNPLHSVQAYTPGLAPEAVTTSPIAVRPDRALVGGQVDANGVPTDYWVEYGLTSDYGASSPASGPVDAGSGVDPVNRSRLLVGLEAETTYHFRLVARNGSGTSYGEDQAFTTPAPASGGARRVFEQVTPVSKNNYGVAWKPLSSTPDVGMTAASPDGSAVVVPSWGTFADSTNPLIQNYRSVRGTRGWETRSVSPAPVLDEAHAVYCACRTIWERATPDLSRGLIRTTNYWAGEDTNRPAPDLLGSLPAVDLYEAQADGSARLRSVGSDGKATGKVVDLGPTSAISADGRSVLFGTTAVGVVPELAGKPEFVPDLFERRDGVTRYVGLGPDGNPASECGTQLATTGLGQSTAVSEDGSRIVFENIPCWWDWEDTKQLYVRVDGEDTLHVSQSQRTPADPGGTQAAEFVAASPDGSRILFASNELLTDDAEGSQPHLYEYRVGETEPLRLLMNGLGKDALAISGDARRVFFQSPDALAPGATPGPANLYVLDEEGVEWIAAGRGFHTFNPSDPVKDLQPTPDGNAMVFHTAFDLVGYDTNGKRQVYLYRKGEPLRCLSCAPSATPPAGDARIASGAFRAENAAGTFAGSLTPDGERVAFQTPESLVPGDTNNREDVYEWSAEEGVSLVSPGTGESNSFLLGMSESGRDVFFGTFDPLLAQDVDGRDLDIYVARVGGGFPAAEREPAECVGDVCQGDVSTAPSRDRPASRADGLADDVPAPRVAFSLGRLSGRVAVAPGGRLTVPVRVDRAGRVRVVVTGRVGGRQRTVASAVRRVGRAGTVRVALRLSRAARRQLAVKGRLAARLSVSFGGAGNRQQRSLTLTSSARKGR